MKTQTKQKKAAKEIAEIMYASLRQFSEEEQDRRVKDIQKIGATAGRKRSGKPPKLFHSGEPSFTSARRNSALNALSSLVLIAFSTALTIARFHCASLATLGPRPLTTLVCSRITSITSGSISSGFCAGSVGFFSLGIGYHFFLFG
jgi:hypothetical protein